MAVVGVAGAAIPEGMPAVMTITMAIGVQAMARRKAIIRRMPAIEAIGSISVICTDKTGTLIHNEMMVTQVETPDGGTFHIDGEGYAPTGEVLPKGKLGRLTLAAALCNDSRLYRKDAHRVVEGDPIEGALLAFAGKIGGDHSARRLDAIPFESRHRFMAVLSEGRTGPQVHLKGAPERVLRMCAGIDRDHWLRRAEVMAGKGLRVLALAEGSTSALWLEDAHLEGHMTLLGLVGLIGQPRPKAIAAVAECQAAGVRVKMITGDHAGTASAISTEIGLRAPHSVLTGQDLDAMGDAELAARVTEGDVYARTSPENKLRLVKALQASGLSVAMTGDGVNDAQALKRADAGIAMGLKGSDAAREAADLVLADDNFATLTAAVRKGRTVWDNLQKVISYEVSTSAGEALTVVVALLAGYAMPITAAHIL